MKDDFEEAKGALKQKEDEIRLYKEQVEKMGNGEFPKSPMDGDILGTVRYFRNIDHTYQDTADVRRSWLSGDWYTLYRGECSCLFLSILLQTSVENASALMLRLHEAESKLAVVQSEKESAEEQV